MIPRSIVILGSTGSIGKSTLDVISRHPGRFIIRGLAAHGNADLLVEQAREFHPEYVCIVDTAKADRVKGALAGESIKVLAGEQELLTLVALRDVEIVVNAVVGAAGLKASLETVSKGKILALANKESLVTGGSLFAPIIAQSKAKILPIDSEHSAIWQAMCAGRPNEVRSIILTASGGPFRDLPLEKFGAITLEQALAHPTWKMGAKITIDSATMANKGLEIIEAVTLFGVTADMIKVLIHPQSVIHSMVEFVDSSVVAQLSRPDMRLPISYALFWPERVQSEFGRVDWKEMKSLTFEPPDHEKFPLVKLAFEVAKEGGTLPAAFNAANEVAVAAFLRRSIRFNEIADIVRMTVKMTKTIPNPTLEQILEADRLARDVARKHTEKAACC
jgi:1-deoxy-D-xylulose-5-phosphate reductoisomerase